MPALIRKVLTAKERGDAFIEAWGGGSAVRDFLFVDDAIEAVLRAAEVYDKPEPMNIGSGAPVSIKELLGAICVAAGFHGEIRWDHEKPEGQKTRILDTKRMESELGFHAAVPLKAGLEKTIAWHREAMSNEKH